MAGHEIAVCDEGVAELRKLSQAITGKLEELLSAKDSLRAVADEHNNKLGPHIKSLYEALDEIVRITKDAEGPCEMVSEKLIKTAEKYQDIIDDDPFR